MKDSLGNMTETSNKHPDNMGEGGNGRILSLRPGLLSQNVIIKDQNHFQIRLPQDA